MPECASSARITSETAPPSTMKMPAAAATLAATLL
jgi:hypothetical protein